MQPKSIVAKVQSSDLFKEWYKEHDSAYLAHVMYMDGEGEIDSYDIGYYLKAEDRMASFGLTKDVVEFRGVSEVFKRPGHIVKELDLSTVNTSFEQALEAVKALQEKEYPTAKPFRRIILLQHLDVGQVWNVTYVTQTFKTLNIKVDAGNGEVLEHNLLDLIQKAL